MHSDKYISNKSRKCLTLLGVLFFSMPLWNSSLWAKTYLVTCATSELGQAIAQGLATDGYSLLLAARNKESLAKIAENLRNKHPDLSINTVELDFETPQKVNVSAAQIVQKVSETKLDGIVLVGPRPSFSTQGIPTAAEWLKSLQETFIGPLEILRQVAGSLKKPSSLVIISGITSKRYSPSYPNTNVIRLMWTGELKNLVHQLAPSQTRVNAISPAVILTSHNEDLLKKRAQEAHLTLEAQLQKETSTIPAARHGRADDLVSAVKFLLSDQASFINGENIALDGGANTSY